MKNVFALSSLALLAIACGGPDAEPVDKSANSYSEKSACAFGDATRARIDALFELVKPVVEAHAGRVSTSTSDVRELGVLAQYDFVQGERLGDSAYTAKALGELDTLLDGYQVWGRRWLSSIPAFQVLYAAWIGWEHLDEGDPKIGGRTRKQRVAFLASDEAAFWAWAWDEAVNRPREHTISRAALNPWQLPNRCLVTGEIRGADLPPDHPDVLASAGCPSALRDTKAEESSSAATLLAVAANMFPDHPQSARWNERARWFAQASISTGRAFDQPSSGVFTQTLGPYDGKDEIGQINSQVSAGDWVLGNHEGGPNAAYTIGTIGALQQAALAYHASRRTPPAEIGVGVADVRFPRYLDSYLWRKSVAPCIEQERSADWVRRRFKVAWYVPAGQRDGVQATPCRDAQHPLVLAFPLAYWSIVDGDGAATEMLDEQIAGLTKSGRLIDERLAGSASVSALTLPDALEKHVQIPVKAWLYARAASSCLPKPDAPLPDLPPTGTVTRKVAFRTHDGRHLAIAGDGRLVAGNDPDVFEMSSAAVRYLRDGDSVTLRSPRGSLVAADGGGGSVLREAGTFATYDTRFTVHKISGGDPVVRDGDYVAVSITKLGGGDPELHLAVEKDAVVMNRPAIGAWETLVLEAR